MSGCEYLTTVTASRLCTLTRYDDWEMFWKGFERKHYLRRNWDQSRIPQSGQLVSWPRFELRTSSKEVYSVTYRSTCSVVVGIHFWKSTSRQALGTIHYLTSPYIPLLGTRTKSMKRCLSWDTDEWWANQEMLCHKRFITVFPPPENAKIHQQTNPKYIFTSYII
jgi:hypothetical protein